MGGMKTEERRVGFMGMIRDKSLREMIRMMWKDLVQ
jgi:hypothetical protein